MVRVPNAPRTPKRSIRVSEEDWDEAREITEFRGETITEICVTAIRAYNRKHRHELEERPEGDA